MMEREIRKLVAMLVDKYQCNDPYRICERLHISVITEYLGKSNGYFLKVKDIVNIYINSTLDGNVRRAVCSHELGHALLHTNTNIRFMTECTFFSENSYERQANLFGAHLMLYDLKKRMPEYDGYSWQEIAIIECVPTAFVRLKLGVQ